MQVDEEETYGETPPELLEMVERSEERKAQPVMKETQPIHLGTADEPQEVSVGTTLTLEERTSLIDLLKEYKDVFAWSYDDMPGLSIDIVKHKIPLYHKGKQGGLHKGYCLGSASKGLLGLGFHWSFFSLERLE